MPEPEAGPGDLLVDAIALGVCGTDREIMAGEYGWAPPGADRLILGHVRSAGVAQAPAGSDFAPGDLVVGVVRRPDPEPCPACARGEFDFCRNGRCTERGIKELHGFGSERWAIEAEYAVKLDPRLEPVGMLMEPTTIVAKAWDQIARVGARALFGPQPRARHRRGADRPARRDARRPARPRGARARPRHRRPEAAAREGPRRPLPLQRRRDGHQGGAARRDRRGHRRRPAGVRRDRVQRPRRHRLPHRRLAGRAAT